MIAEQICILTAFSAVPQNFLIFRCCLSHLKKLCEASHNFFYVKHIVMRSDWKSISDYQGDTKTLLRSTSHNIGYFFRPLSQSRRF